MMLGAKGTNAGRARAKVTLDTEQMHRCAAPHRSHITHCRRFGTFLITSSSLSPHPQLCELQRLHRFLRRTASPPGIRISAFGHTFIAVSHTFRQRDADTRLAPNAQPITYFEQVALLRCLRFAVPMRSFLVILCLVAVAAANHHEPDHFSYWNYATYLADANCTNDAFLIGLATTSVGCLVRALLYSKADLIAVGHSVLCLGDRALPRALPGRPRSVDPTLCLRCPVA